MLSAKPHHIIRGSACYTISFNGMTKMFVRGSKYVRSVRKMFGYLDLLMV